MKTPNAKKKESNWSEIVDKPMFLFSPRRAFLPFAVALLGFGSEWDLIRAVPRRISGTATELRRRVIDVTRDLDSARVDLEDVVDEGVVVLPDLRRRHTGNVAGNLVPAVGEVLRHEEQSALEELVVVASPLSGLNRLSLPPSHAALVKHRSCRVFSWIQNNEQGEALLLWSCFRVPIPCWFLCFRWLCQTNKKVEREKQRERKRNRERVSLSRRFRFCVWWET